ncbi:uncharacterized protein [Brachionichthys hirsutus]|uniref:uncharacterized protein n=1 Tax=Brachionichthys hirsutus TaxID=412623 RepID=UPI0036044379
METSVHGAGHNVTAQRCSRGEHSGSAGLDAQLHYKDTGSKEFLAAEDHPLESLLKKTREEFSFLRQGELDGLFVHIVRMLERRSRLAEDSEEAGRLRMQLDRLRWQTEEFQRTKRDLLCWTCDLERELSLQKPVTLHTKLWIWPHPCAKPVLNFYILFCYGTSDGLGLEKNVKTSSLAKQEVRGHINGQEPNEISQLRVLRQQKTPSLRKSDCFFEHVQSAKSSCWLMHSRLKRAAFCIARLSREKQQLIEMNNRLRSLTIASGLKEGFPQRDLSTKCLKPRHDSLTAVEQLQYQLTGQELQYGLRQWTSTSAEHVVPESQGIERPESSKKNKENTPQLSRTQPHSHLEGGPQPHSHLEGGPQPHSHLEGGPQPHSHLEGGPQPHSHLEGGPQPHSHLEGGPQPHSHLEGGPQPHSHLEGGPQPHSHLEGGPQPHSHLEGGPQPHSHLEGGPQPHSHLEGGPQPHSHLEGGPLSSEESLQSLNQLWKIMDCGLSTSTFSEGGEGEMSKRDAAQSGDAGDQMMVNGFSAPVHSRPPTVVQQRRTPSTTPSNTAKPRRPGAQGKASNIRNYNVKD